MFNQVTFIGLGLIGSSLARVIRAQGLAKKLSPAAVVNVPYKQRWILL
jgi:prephenate dehydrogenase